MTYPPAELHKPGDVLGRHSLRLKSAWLDHTFEHIWQEWLKAESINDQERMDATYDALRLVYGMYDLAALRARRAIREATEWAAWVSRLDRSSFMLRPLTKE